MLVEGNARKSMTEPVSTDAPMEGMLQKSVADEHSSGKDSPGETIKDDTDQHHLPTMMGRTSGNKVVVFSLVVQNPETTSMSPLRVQPPPPLLENVL